MYSAKDTWVAFLSAVIRKIPHRNNLNRSGWLGIEDLLSILVRKAWQQAHEAASCTASTVRK